MDKVQILVSLALLCVTAEANWFPKSECTFRTNETKCQELFQHLSSNTKTRLIFIHLKNDNLTGPDWKLNPLLEFVWVNRSSVSVLAYPDDFHALTFGMLTDNMYEIDVNIPMELNDTNESLSFLFSNLVLNNTFGEICHRYIIYDNDTAHAVFRYFSIWIGFDYECFLSAEENGRIIAKMTTTIILISVLGIICILWFPLIFVVIDQNKVQMKKRDQEENSFGGIHEEGETENEHDHTDTYDRGDVPYGFQRLFIVCFHSNVRRPIPLSLSHFRLVLVVVITMAIISWLSAKNENTHVLPDVKNYKSLYLYTMEPNCIFVLISLCYLALLCYIPIVSYKNYTYCFDLLNVFRKDTFLTKIQFSDILGTISDNNLFHNLINRFCIIFHVQFWFRIFYKPFCETNFVRYNTCKKCLLFLPCLLLMLCNIFFQVLATFPLLWYFFHLVLLLLNKYIRLYGHICEKICSCEPGTKTCMVFKLFISMLLGLGCYFVVFLILFDKSSITSAIPSTLKMICYTFLIALPQMKFIYIRLVFATVTLLSYCVQHFKSLTNLYKELLDMIFIIHGEKQKDVNVKYVEMKEFDFVAAHVFPFRVQAFYFFSKLLVTGIFFFITVAPFFHINSDKWNENMQLDSIMSFIFILVSPGIAEFLLNSSPKSKIMSNKEEIRNWVDKWQSIEEPRSSIKVHRCSCPCNNYFAKLCCNCFTFCTEINCGCFFEFTKENECNLCILSIPKDESNSDSYRDMRVNEKSALVDRQPTNEGLQYTKHYLSIKFPDPPEKPTVWFCEDENLCGSCADYTCFKRID